VRPSDDGSRDRPHRGCADDRSHHRSHRGPDAGAVLGTNRGVPASPVVRKAIAGQSTPADAAVYQIYNEIADRTIPQGPNLPNDQEFVNQLKLLGQSVAYGQSTVDKASTDLIALINRLSTK